MEPRDWDYAITNCLRVVDGDTYDLTLHKAMDFGFRLIEDKYWSARLRLLDIDTPERNEALGSAATDFADAWIHDALGAGVLRGQTFKTDHFGRWLIDLYRTDTGQHLSDALREAGLEKPEA